MKKLTKTVTGPLVKYLILLGVLAAAWTALAGPTVMIPPSDVNVYDVKFLAFPGTDSICFFEREVGESTLEQSAAIMCVDQLIADGVTQNVSRLTLPRSQDVPIVARAYRSLGDDRYAASAVSNDALLVVVAPPVLED